MPQLRQVMAMVLVCAGLSAAQTIVYIDDNNPATGTNNSFPWNQTGGFTTLHVYTAAQLTAGGVAAGAVLSGIGVAPAPTSTSGTYNAPQARLSVGHLANNPPVAGMWEANIANPTVIHDLTSGAYTFPWTVDTWTALPGVGNACFTWNGTSDIAIYYTSSAGVTGPFWAHRTGTNLRHAVTVFNPTNQAPTSNGLFAMKVRLTFSTGSSASYQLNQAASWLDVDGIQSQTCQPANVHRAPGVASLITAASVNLNFPFEVGITSPHPLVPYPGGALQLPFSGQLVNLDLTAPSFTFLFGGTFPPFPGTMVIPFASATSISFSAQMVVADPPNPDGVALSGPFTLSIP